MMYPFLTLDDETEITHSEMLEDGKVKVYIETPDEKDGFHNAACLLPEYRWSDIRGYSEAEMIRFQELIRENAHLILEFSQRDTLYANRHLEGTECTSPKNTGTATSAAPMTA